MKVFNNIFLAGFMVLIVSSCSAPKVSIPGEVLSPDKMVAILSDMEISESVITFKYTNKDTAMYRGYEYYNAIYRNHKITKDQFSKSYDFYLAHPDILNKIYDEVLTELSKRQGKARQQ